jgi:arsenate reductase
MEMKPAVTALAALAHESRLSVFRLLVEAGPEGLAAGQISDRLGVPPSSLSFHLKELSYAGLVTSRQQGRFVIYAANFIAMNDLLAFLTENCCGGESCAPGAATTDGERQAINTSMRSDQPQRSFKERQMTDKLKVLFLCTGNACRSQISEGWARALKSDVIEPYSAGVAPHGVDPRAVRVMAEAGVDISGHTSKHLDALKDVTFDYVVTVCDNAAESCPIFPGKVKKVHQGFQDPPRLAKDANSEEEALSHYRRVRDEIRAFIQTLPEALGAK